MSAPLLRAWMIPASVTIGIHAALPLLPIPFGGGDGPEPPAAIRVSLPLREAPPPEPIAEPTVDPPPAPPTRPSPRVRRHPTANAPTLPPVEAEPAGEPEALVPLGIDLPDLPLLDATPPPLPPPTQARRVDLGAYRHALRDSLLAHRRYPPMARRIRLEGVVEVEVVVGRDGSLAAAPEIVGTSGHELLDREVERMVHAAAPFPPLPEGYPERTAILRIPVRFYLAD